MEEEGVGEERRQPAALGRPRPGRGCGRAPQAPWGPQKPARGLCLLSPVTACVPQMLNGVCMPLKCWFEEISSY